MSVVTVNRRTAAIKVVASGGVLSPAASGSGGVTLINQGAAIGAATQRLDQLQDVVEGTPSDGDVLVYRASDDKYVVQPLNISNSSLDGGSF